jgi:hypothetical protein
MRETAHQAGCILIGCVIAMAIFFDGDERRCSLEQRYEREESETG